MPAAGARRSPLAPLAPRRIAPLALALGLNLGLTLGIATPSSALAQAAATAQHFDLPAQPLAQALFSLGDQARLQIVFDPALVRGRSSPALKAMLTPLQALERLLEGSGLGFALRPGNVVVVEAGKETALPQVDVTAGLLPEVRVVAQAESMGSMSLDREKIDALAGGNGDITSLLRIHPSVQFDNNQLASGNQGEIAPADISINGAKYYTNLYRMDGMSINNDINPANRTADGTSGSNNNAAPPSASQGFAIDSSLLCNITVRDANVPAEFGRFSGGVVEADTCAPTRSFGGQVSVEHTRSEWMKQYLSPAQEEIAAWSATENTQPDFEKWTYRLALQGKPTENLGLIGSVVRRTSEIPLKGYSRGNSQGDDSDKVQSRYSDNYFLRGFWTPGGELGGDFSLLYAPAGGSYFIADARNSDFDLRSGGYGVNLGLHHALGKATVNHRLTWNKMESSRESDGTTWKGWRYSADKNWGLQTSASSATGWMSYEGGFGDVDQTQETVSYQAKADWEAFRLLGLEHRIQAGLELSHQRFDYERKTQYTQYTTSADTSTCNMVGGGVDTETCSLSTPWNSSAAGQYLRSRLIYFAGSFAVENTSRAFYLQDDMKLGDVRLRLGLRYDADQLAPEATWSPRSAAFWDVFGNGSTRLEGGLNRYYARNFMDNYTRAERLALQSTTQVRSLSGGLLTDWAAPVQSTTWSMWKTGDMKVPYVDEKMLGLSQKWAGTTWSLKRVLRESRDELVMHLRSAANYYADNVGYSDARSWTLTAETDQPIRFSGTATHVLLAVDKTSVTTSHTNYSDVISELTGGVDRTIIYDGKAMAYGDRPADNYARPWTARLLLNTQIPAWRLTVGNFFRVRDGFEKMVNTGTSVPYDGGTAQVWEKHKFGKAIAWDMRLNWSLPVAAGQEAFVALSIDNLLSRKNEIEDGDYGVKYEKGRQYWLELGYRF
ncbi:TonB-dependent receptor [Azoarcus indigens]|uniref:TonB-dependent receptor-like protein n=1 Tax=Azoarcus indigens TaxID=29545 RepID=A0A4R6DR13_9RHOO|nr:TonB-dependent receptor [Azoarcus indigens]TDN47525.1 TonB-dependent receptor-like protein [Azoarcus indigens]